LQPIQRTEVLAKFSACSLPLYLRLAYEEARRWRSYDDLPVRPDAQRGLSDDIPGVMRDLFRRLSAAANHGPLLVSRSLGYLAAARHGLAEDELLDALSRDVGVYADFLKGSWHVPPDLLDHVTGQLRESDAGRSLKEADRETVERAGVAWLRELGRDDEPLRAFLAPLLARLDGPRLPVVLWSRLSLDLAPLLAERSADGASLLGFYHRQLGEVVAADYLGSADGRERHASLARYFGNQPLWLVGDGNGKRASNARKVAERPYQQTFGQCWSELEATLTDLDFVEAKCTAGLTYDLVDDYNRLGVGRAPPGPAIRTALLREGAYTVQCPYCLGSFAIDRHQLGETLACLTCGQRLKLNSFAVEVDWQPVRVPPTDTGARLGRPAAINAPLAPTVTEFAELVRGQAHVLAAYPSLVSQQAANWLEGSAPARAAAERRRQDERPPPWLRWANKPRESDPCLFTLTGHSGKVPDCAYSPDGRRIISGSWDNTLRIWDAATGAGLATFRSSEELWAIAVHPFASGLATGGSAGGVYVLSLEDHRLGPPVVTAWRDRSLAAAVRRLWRRLRRRGSATKTVTAEPMRIAFGCPRCRAWSEVAGSALGTERECPHCGQPISLNPFTIDADWRPIAKA
jgi:WD domain, G-beta repeat